MIETNMFKDLGISTKTEFEDAEYNGLLEQYPQVNELHKEMYGKKNRSYTNIEKELTSAQTNLEALQERNSNLPDNSERITELTTLIAAIDEGTLMQQIEYKAVKDEYVAEKAQLEAEQTPSDTTEVETRIDTLTAELSDQKTVVNGLCAGMGMGDLI